MREAMRSLGVSRQTVLQRVKRGELDALREITPVVGPEVRQALRCGKIFLPR
jgi:hypothetical protein